MVKKDRTRNRTIGGTPLSNMVAIEFEEICCICSTNIPKDTAILRHHPSLRIICRSCLLEIFLQDE